MEWLTFEDVPFVDVIEDGSTFEENALKKARQIFQQTQLPVLAEDKPELLDQLNAVGIDEMSIFPEDEHICRHLRRAAGLPKDFNDA